MARFLGPSDFGLLTVSIATLTLVTDIADFGTNTGIVKFVSSHIQNDKDKAFKFLKLALETKLFVWVVVIILGNLGASFMADNFFQKPELLTPLRLAMFGVGTALLFWFATSSLQAFQKYYLWSIVNIVTNGLRILAILLLLFYQQLNIVNSLLSFMLVPFFGFCLTLLFLPTKKILKAKGEFELSRQFFKYNFGVALFTVIAAISSRLDTFLTARLLTTETIGIYSAANQLVQAVPQLVGALGVVVAPKFASFTSKSDMLAYFKKFQTLVSGLVIFGVLIIPIFFYLIPLLYGPAYQGAITPFIILYLAMLVFLFSVPLHNSIIFYFGKPNVFVWVSLGHLLIIAILGWILISNFSITGAALTVFVGMLFNFFAPLFWFIQKTKK